MGRGDRRLAFWIGGICSIFQIPLGIFLCDERSEQTGHPEAHQICLEFGMEFQFCLGLGPSVALKPRKATVECRNAVACQGAKMTLGELAA